MFQVYENEELHRTAVSELEEKLMRLEEEAGRHQQVLDHTNKHSQQLLAELQEDKLRLQVNTVKQLFLASIKVCVFECLVILVAIMIT